MEWQKYKKKAKIYWSADGSSQIPNIEPHTKIKHLLVSGYLEDWVETIVGRCKFATEKITIVDGFCGGGIYRDENGNPWQGSPLRIIQAVESSWEKVQHEKPYQKLDIAYRFVDARIEHTTCLENQIRAAGFGSLIDSGRCEIITQDFEDFLQPCLDWLRERKGHSFFFLDPFGLVDFPAMSAAILRLGKAEVLLNHMQHDGIIRPVGWHRKHGNVTNFLSKYNLSNHYQWLEELQDLPLLTQQSLLNDSALRMFRELSKPRFTWTFAFMKDITVYYYLIHLSNNSTAVSVMRRVLWKYNNLQYQFHYGTFGLGYRTVEDLEQNLSLLDIHETNVQKCQEKLRESIDKLLHNHDDQIPFKQILERTIEQNPATREDYMHVIHQMSKEKDIEIKRDNTQHDKSRLVNRDLIRVSGTKQFSLFTIDTPFTKQKSKSRLSQDTTPQTCLDEQLIFPGLE
jgi:three-Cys-motif partner protein